MGPQEAAQLVRDSGGCRTAKVKVAEPGQSLEQDLARVAIAPKSDAGVIPHHS